jgi:hypothetical protein
MKKFTLVLLLAVCTWYATLAQSITANVSEIIFNETDELGLDSASVSIINGFAQSRTLKKADFHFLDTYGVPAFFVKIDSLVLPAEGSATFKVYFKPRHNITHQSSLVIRTHSGVLYNYFGNVAIQLTGQGKYSKNYYSSTQNLKEQALRDALKTRISSGYTSLGYNVARNRMFEEIDNKRLNGQGATVNTLECIYTTTLCTGYTNRANAQSMCNFDTEHTFPQGFFNSAEPMLSDLYHLFPTRSNANNSRGNLAFGVATQPYQQEAINAPSKKGANNLYEPHDGQKGATARAMMYFVLRYQDYSNFFAPQENILRQWHSTFLPNAVELRRNDDIAALQNNRNPFIDYPQFAERITKLVGPSVEVPIFALRQYDSLITYYNNNNIADSTNVIEYVLVNKGNQTINISQILPGDNMVRIINGQNVSILPGRAHTLRMKIRLTAAPTQNHSITFSTNIPNGNTVTVPIQIIQVISGNEEVLNKQRVDVYPNPARENFMVKFAQPVVGNTRLELTDMLGKSIPLNIQSADFTTFECSTKTIPAGVYHLKVSQPGVQSVIKKLVVNR